MYINSKLNLGEHVHVYFLCPWALSVNPGIIGAGAHALYSGEE